MYVTVLHTSVTDSRWNWTVWLCWWNVPYARRYASWCDSPAFAVKFPAQYLQFLDKNFEKYSIICSPGIRHVLSVERGHFQHLIQHAKRCVWRNVRRLVCSVALFFLNAAAVTLLLQSTRFCLSLFRCRPKQICLIPLPWTRMFITVTTDGSKMIISW